LKSAHFHCKVKMGKSRRGGGVAMDDVSVYRGEEKRKRMEFKRNAQKVTKSLRASLESERMSAKKIQEHLDKLGKHAATLTPEQQALRAQLEDKLEAVRVLEQQHREAMIEEQRQRRAAGRNLDAASGSSDDSSDEDSSENEDEGPGPAHKQQQGAKQVVHVDANSAWGAVFTAAPPATDLAAAPAASATATRPALAAAAARSAGASSATAVGVAAVAATNPIQVPPAVRLAAMRAQQMRQQQQRQPQTPVDTAQDADALLDSLLS
jgi:hypothetical protein